MRPHSIPDFCLFHVYDKIHSYAEHDAHDSFVRRTGRSDSFIRRTWRSFIRGWIWEKLIRWRYIPKMRGAHMSETYFLSLIFSHLFSYFLSYEKDMSVSYVQVEFVPHIWETCSWMRMSDMFRVWEQLICQKLIFSRMRKTCSVSYVEVAFVSHILWICCAYEWKWATCSEYERNS